MSTVLFLFAFREIVISLHRDSTKISSIRCGIFINPCDNFFFLPKEEMKNSRARKRIYELLSKAAAGTSKGDCDQRELHFVFFRQPERFLESDESKGHVSGVNLEKTILESKCTSS